MLSGPSIFIGSSSEALHIAEQVQYDLHREMAPVVWHQGIFGLGSTTLDVLLREVEQRDFAILVLSLDDMTTSREALQSSPRDNVIFELGLFMGG